MDIYTPARRFVIFYFQGNILIGCKSGAIRCCGGHDEYSMYTCAVVCVIFLGYHEGKFKYEKVVEDFYAYPRNDHYQHHRTLENRLFLPPVQGVGRRSPHACTFWANGFSLHLRRYVPGGSSVWIRALGWWRGDGPLA